MADKLLNSQIKEIKLKLPADIVDSVLEKEILEILIDKAYTKMAYYKSRCNEMEEKHEMNFNTFKKRVNNSKKENFSAWDNCMIWEGYMLAYKEWHNKYKKLKQCSK